MEINHAIFKNTNGKSDFRITFSSNENAYIQIFSVRRKMY